MISSNNQYDVIVVGAGPAGATAATLLAQHGRRVVLLEREGFPRYHVGESLLPFCYDTLNRLGLVEKLNDTAFVKKYSVQFATMDGRMSQPFYFFDHLDGHPSGQTWQVERADFDRMMTDNAQDNGVEVRFGVSANKVLQSSDGRVTGIQAKDEHGQTIQLHAPMTIDASGRNGFAANAMGWKRKRDPELNKIALWTYYKGGKRGEGRDEGATTVAYIPEKGWFWHIPMHDDRISLGVVGERSYLYRDGLKDPLAVIEREVGCNEWVKDAMADAEQFGETWVTGDYSYRSEHSATDGLVLTGDAFGFLDPVFSSGVFLALTSGQLAADTVHEALSDNDPSAQRFEAYTDEFQSGIEAMRKLVYAFYTEGFSFGKLLKKHPHLRSDLTDCLIGNMATDFGPLFEAVAEFVDVPEPLAYGRPLVLFEHEA
ncbi:MAG: tryptophan 7-halogenase [Phycisphaeraceae bacterium]|nr:tryptophan 7-halogenase [Phycisphaeraceae bacterium]